ncbi:MAG: hypothetical protein ACQETL_12790 [Bacteroidota bacterium]
MNKKKSLYLFIGLLFIFISPISAQSSYVSTDSLMITGIKILHFENQPHNSFISINYQGRLLKIYAEDIAELKISEEEEYVSRNVEVYNKTSQLLLRKITTGKLSLYSYQNGNNYTFFIEKDNHHLIKLSENDYIDQLSQITSDYNWRNEQYKVAKFNKKSLSKLISIYNNSNNNPLPFARFGMLIGYNTTLLKVSSPELKQTLNGLSFTLSSSFSVGLFMDVPIDMSNLSFNFGANISKSNFSASLQKQNSDIDAVINLTSISAPLLLRYTIPTLKWRPFFNIGGIYTYNLRNDNGIYEASLYQNIISINEVIKESIVSKNMFGFTSGFGIQHMLNFRQIISTEFRFNYVSGSKFSLKKNQLELLFSYSF